MEELLMHVFYEANMEGEHVSFCSHSTCHELQPSHMATLN